MIKTTLWYQFRIFISEDAEIRLTNKVYNRGNLEKPVGNVGKSMNGFIHRPYLITSLDPVVGSSGKSEVSVILSGDQSRLGDSVNSIDLGSGYIVAYASISIAYKQA